MVNISFNKKRCVELIAESNKLRQQGKFLWDSDKTKNKELTHYLTLLYDDVFWKSKYEYLEILESFISKSIDVEQFIQKFYDLRGSNMKAAKMRKENLENEIEVLLNPKSPGFTAIISAIHTLTDLFNPEITLSDYGIREELLRITLKNHYLPRIRKKIL